MGKETLAELTSDPILIGEWTFYPGLFKLEREQENVKLEPRAAHLLYRLCQQPNSPIPRESLMAEVWPNMVVGDEALTSAITKLRKALSDDSHYPEYIETIPKAGYRLIANVELTQADNASVKLPTDNQVNSHPVSSSRRLVPIIAGSLLILLVLTGYFMMKTPISKNETVAQTEPSMAPVELPSIVVLPFENISKDIDQEYFVDGITEDIITDLSRISNLRVLARNTTFRYKGQSLDLQQIAKDLNVDYVLEGSVRKVGNNLRISARLFDVSSAQSLWAERYDRKLQDVFKVQDDVTHSIVTSLHVQLTKQDKEVLESPTTTNFKAYDLFLKAQQLLNERTKESNLQAIENYHEAIKLDPSFARAYGALSVALIRASSGAYIESRQEAIDQALVLARKATSLNNKSQNTFWALSFVHLYRQEYREAAREIQKAMIIAPSYADGLALKALIENHLGNAEEAIKLIKQAMLHNPYYSWDYLYNLGWAEYTQGNYENAVELLKNALERNENARPARLILAVSLIALEEQDDAEWEIEQILTQFPSTTITTIKRDLPMAHEENMKLYISRLREAGIPE